MFKSHAKLNTFMKNKDRRKPVKTAKEAGVMAEGVRRQLERQQRQKEKQQQEQPEEDSSDDEGNIARYSKHLLEVRRVVQDLVPPRHKMLLPKEPEFWFQKGFL